MIGYVTIGSNDPPRSRNFYTAILSPLGGRIVLDTPKMIFFATDGGATMLAITRPYDGGAASYGNGSMFGVPAPSAEMVDQIYAIAVEQGAKIEGPPGYRTPEIYIAYFRDPCGNKLAIYNIASVQQFTGAAQAMVSAQLSSG